ncbi:MAG TPA: alpha-mannosidase [Phycisphaerales bacterium]|nr:alpha-mannosidase [Phycisphaerales bacterium]
MAKSQRNIHLLCNAHLDPVWLWEWEEGAAEAISTFRTAAEMAEKDKAFVFNHNEAILYKWVREYEPALFERIQRLVKLGKWHIMGGWYLQPDCNMPSGESFIRQILLGRAFFRKHFGVEPTTAINFDPFGHTRGLVQILAKCGYDAYLFGRPDQNDCPLPADDFVWVGYDGSEVMATRFKGWYNSPLGHAAEKVAKWAVDYPEASPGLILWGVGNHGGGPSRKDLRDINALIARTREPNILHSTPEAYFHELQRRRTALPRHRKDLNPWAVGCYTSAIRIKQKMRRLENEIYSLEKMASTAAVQGLMDYPAGEIHEALCDLMTGQFHDILPGSSIQAVEEASLRLLDHGLEMVARAKARAFFSLASGQKRPRDGQIPILVYNPHPFKVLGLVECEFNLPDFQPPEVFYDVQVRGGNTDLPTQVEQEASNLAVDWRKRVVFHAELAPGVMNRFDCVLMQKKRKPSPRLKARRGLIRFATKDLNVTINTRTGLIDRWRARGVDLVAGRAFEPLVMKDNADPWGMTTRSYRKVVGRFRLMRRPDAARFRGLDCDTIDPVRVIEDGAARSVVEAVFAWGDSFVCQRYHLPKRGTQIHVQTRVIWNEKDRMLKLSIPVRPGSCRYVGQVACGTGELPSNGDEAVAQKWTAVVDDSRKTALTCINDGIYGSDFSEDGLRLTLLRSPAYSCHPHDGRLMTPAQDRFTPRIDQGERLFHFWLDGGRAGERLRHIDREALARNERPVALSFNPPAQGVLPRPLAVLSDDVVQIMAIKQAENGRGLIIRLFEPTGRGRTTTLTLPALKKKIRVELGGFEIRTLRIDPRTGKHVDADLLERILRR